MRHPHAKLDALAGQRQRELLGVGVGHDELDAVQIESNHTIDIDNFVPRDEIDRDTLDAFAARQNTTDRFRTAYARAQRGLPQARPGQGGGGTEGRHAPQSRRRPLPDDGPSPEQAGDHYVPSAPVADRSLLTEELRAKLAEVLRVVESLAAEGMTLMMVTHEMAFARDVSSRVVFLHQGRVAEEGSPDEMFRAPRSAEFQRFIANFR